MRLCRGVILFRGWLPSGQLCIAEARAYLLEGADELVCKLMGTEQPCSSVNPRTACTARITC